MKNRNTYIYIVLALVLLGFFYFWNKLEESSSQIDWRETYDYQSREPYGTSIVYELLGDYFPYTPITLTDSLPQEWNTNGNYIFIGEATNLDTTALNSLISFVKQGGYAFFSSKTIPDDLMDKVFFYNCEETAWSDYISYRQDSVALNFLHPDLRAPDDFIYSKIVRQRAVHYPWHEVKINYFCDEADGFISLASTDDASIHFTKIPVGQGQLFLHTIPLTFTNIQVLDTSGITYVEKVFSHLQDGPIYWDAMSQTSEFMARARNSSSPKEAGPGPLSYILKQPALAWAWYLLVAATILYVIFRAKRKQRIIPVLAPNKNTSLEFIGTIGYLYFMQNDHRKLCLEMLKQWQFYIRERYHIATKEMDTAFIQKVGYKAEVKEKTLTKLVKYATNIESSSFVSETTLGEFHQLLASFYKKCK